ncbi:MAG: hypothetical protein Q9202_005812 [Teloschistes flavicans]
MYAGNTLYLGLGLLAMVSADAINKPPLAQNFGYLTQGLLDNLHAPANALDQWPPGSLPQACADETSTSGLNPADLTTYSIHYTDCEQPWVVCTHKDAPMTITTLVDLFGKIPIRARSHVRHLVNLPTSTNANAYTHDGIITLLGIANDGIDVFLHETGHCLDAGGYAGRSLSASPEWQNAIAQDPNVPDPYSGVSPAEDVAQCTVIATYNIVVPGGFGMLEPNWRNVYHQYALLQSWAEDSGNLLTPGGTCMWRTPDSPTVALGGATTTATKERRAKVAAVARQVGKQGDGIPEGIEVLPVKTFHTECYQDIH